MKIPMNLAQAVRKLLQPPSPLQAKMLDLLQHVWGQKWMVRRVAVHNAHDALSMSYQLTYMPNIKTRLWAWNFMDHGQVIDQGIDASQVECRHLAGILKAAKI